MKRFFVSILVAGLLAGCSGAADTTASLPTIDPHLLTITPAPSITPEATFTPFPTTVRLASNTPPPTYAPLVTLIPFTLAPVVTAEKPVVRQPTKAAPTATSVIGIPGVGPDRAELAPILTFEPLSFCHQWMIAQIGVVNRGTAAALNFDVEWTFGWGEPQKVHVDELQWYAGPLYFFSGQTAVQCDSTTTLKAWIKIDTGNTVDESIEDNNYKEQIYTSIFPSPTP